MVKFLPPQYILFGLLIIGTLPSHGTVVQTTNIVFVGDSITEGSIGASYIDELYNIGYPWNSESVSLINSGTNGYRTSYFYNNDQNVLRKVFDWDANYVIVFLGLNDVEDLNPAGFDIHYRYFIDALYRLDKENQIHGIFLVKFTYSNAVNEIMALEYQEVIGNISSEFHLPLVDLWNVTYLQWDYYNDNSHFNELGAQVVAKEIDEVLGNLIELLEFSSSSTRDFAYFTSGNCYILIIFGIYRKLRSK